MKLEKLEGLISYYTIRLENCKTNRATKLKYSSAYDTTEVDAKIMIIAKFIRDLKTLL